MTGSQHSQDNDSSNIASDEKLARGIFEKTQARSARNGNVTLNVFLEINQRCLSVDRLTCENMDTLVAIGGKRAGLREPQGKRTFYGWAIVMARDAARDGRIVEASPTFCNCYHADIILPENVIQDKQEHLQHALDLARQSRWQERPNTV